MVVTISVDTKRPRITDVAFWLRSLARSNNSRVFEAHVMGATIETTFLTFPGYIMQDWYLQLLCRLEKIGVLLDVCAELSWVDTRNIQEGIGRRISSGCSSLPSAQLA